MIKLEKLLPTHISSINKATEKIKNKAVQTSKPNFNDLLEEKSASNSETDIKILKNVKISL